MSAQITLNARNLTRRLGSREVISNVSLQLRRGEVLGLLGHNGAGKSTTMQMLAGVLSPHAGQIEICGFDLAREPARAKACVGYLPETPPLYRDMRVDDYLSYAARLHRVAQRVLGGAQSSQIFPKLRPRSVRYFLTLRSLSRYSSEILCLKKS